MNNDRFRLVSLAAATLGSLLAATVSGQVPAGGPVTGNVERGRTLYADTYNCDACHGFDAQSGERRLVPLNYTQDGFITFVQNSPLPNMPAFPDASAQVLADIYAYIKTIPADAPALDQVPLLKDIRERKARAAAE
ncbi:MAG: cytochrome c [Candidatus Eisenbacteria bacterium]|nr:cytochrome c [Candidatus Eisenbacteria bacterium]